MLRRLRLNMMTKLSCEVLYALAGRTLATAESCTGGGIGAALTAIPGSSQVYKGGIISYTNEVKIHLLGVDPELLKKEGAVCADVAKQMAIGARNRLSSDIAVSVTGLAGPGGDEFGNPVGTVFIGYADGYDAVAYKYVFQGNREDVRNQTIYAAFQLILDQLAL